MLLKARVGERIIEIPKDEVLGLDIIDVQGEGLHLLKGNQSFHVRILDFNAATKCLNLRVNGSDYTIEILDPIDQVIEKMGYASKDEGAVGSLVAPMPGLILKILVGVDDEVEAGQPILILEAMKMENVLKAQHRGRISGIHVSVGDSVGKKELLVEME